MPFLTVDVNRPTKLVSEGEGPVNIRFRIPRRSVFFGVRIAILPSMMGLRLSPVGSWGLFFGSENCGP